MSIFLKNVFNGLFDVTDDIAILPSWQRCIWLNLVNGAGTRHYKVRLTLEEAKKLQEHLSKAIKKVEVIKKKRNKRRDNS